MNNFNAEIMASASRTATTSSSDIKNSGHIGGHIIIDVTVLTAGASIVPTIQGKDSVSGKYYTLLTGVAITATGTTVYRIYPGIVAVTNLAISDILPSEFRVVMTAADTKAVTYSIGINLT
jgi:hypothetical protein